MRIESGALIQANLKLRRQLDIARHALEFYSGGKHFDTVRVEGDVEGVRRTRILDTGGVAEEALTEIKP